MSKYICSIVPEGRLYIILYYNNKHAYGYFSIVKFCLMLVLKGAIDECPYFSAELVKHTCISFCSFKNLPPLTVIYISF